MIATPNRISFIVIASLLFRNYVSAYSISPIPVAKTETEGKVLGRRQWLLGTTTSSLAFIANAMPVEAASFERFNDSTHGFSIDLPSAWKSSESVLFDRRTLLVWTDPEDSATAVFIAYTPVRDDYTSLGSFGSVDQVADQTILPKGKILDPNSDVTAEMLSAVSRNQAYIFDYKQKVGTLQPETHFRTIFTLKRAALNSAGSVLVTITAQAPESRYTGSVKTTLDAIIDSFAPLA